MNNRKQTLSELQWKTACKSSLKKKIHTSQRLLRNITATESINVIILDSSCRPSPDTGDASWPIGYEFDQWRAAFSFYRSCCRWVGLLQGTLLSFV